MSLLKHQHVNFLHADVSSCVTLKSSVVRANELTLTQPLGFGGGVRVGENAGATNQGDNCIAIGAEAAPLDQPDHSIVINATGVPVNAPAPSSCVIAPIRATNGTNVLFYNTTTGEVTQATGGVSQTISVVDNLTVTHNLTFVAGVLTAYSTA
jgi:hypothetical protein